MNRASFIRRALVVAGAVAFAPTRLDKVLLPAAPIGPGAVTAVPVGTIIQTSGAVPVGWIMCDGQPVSKLDHPGLYAVLGTAYGGHRVGRTFRVPDLRGRVAGHPPTGVPAFPFVIKAVA